MTKYAVERASRVTGERTRLGTVTKEHGFYRFVPNVAGRRPSRKPHTSLAACLPPWVGYPDHCETRELPKL